MRKDTANVLVLEIAEMKQLHGAQSQAEKSFRWVNRQIVVPVKELQIEEPREDRKVCRGVGVFPNLFGRSCATPPHLISAQGCGRARFAK
jgi:hypothetical protein